MGSWHYNCYLYTKYKHSTSYKIHIIRIIRELIQKTKKNEFLCYFKVYSKTEDPYMWKYEKGDDVKYLPYEKLD